MPGRAGQSRTGSERTGPDRAREGGREGQQKASIRCALWALQPRPPAAHHSLPWGHVSPRGVLGGLGQLFGTGGGGVGVGPAFGRPTDQGAQGMEHQGTGLGGVFVGGAVIHSKENTHIHPYERVRYSATRAYTF